MSARKLGKRLKALDAADDDAAGRADQLKPKKKREAIQVACTFCQRRKSKCDGAKPSCSLCLQKGTACEYPDDLRRTSHVRSQNQRLAERNKQLEQLFQRLRLAQPEDVQRLLHEPGQLSSPAEITGLRQTDGDSSNAALSASESVLDLSVVEDFDEVAWPGLDPNVDEGAGFASQFGVLPDILPGEHVYTGTARPGSDSLHFTPASGGGGGGQAHPQARNTRVPSGLPSPVASRGLSSFASSTLGAAAATDLYSDSQGATTTFSAQAVAFHTPGSVGHAVIQISQVMPLAVHDPSVTRHGDDLPYGTLCDIFVRDQRQDIATGRNTYLDAMLNNSVDGAALLDEACLANSDPLSSFTYQLTKGCPCDTVTKLGFMHMCQRMIQWLISPCDETFFRLPSMMRPTPEQLLINHPPWIDFIVIPKLRALLIANPELQAQNWQAALATCRVSWDRPLAESFNVDPSSMCSRPSLEFQETIDNPDAWTISSSVLQNIPAFANICRMHDD